MLGDTSILYHMPNNVTKENMAFTKLLEPIFQILSSELHGNCITGLCENLQHDCLSVVGAYILAW